MLDDDQDMADMYLGRRQEADSNSKPEESARQEIEPPSPSHSAESMDDLEPSDFMGQVDSDSETEAPARRAQNTSRLYAPYIKRTTPTKRAQPPPQVRPPTHSPMTHTVLACRSGVSTAVLIVGCCSLRLLCRANCRTASSQVHANEEQALPLLRQASSQRHSHPSALL